VNRIASLPDQRWIGATTLGESGMTCFSFPKIRAPVETWTIASPNAIDASHTFAAIVDEKTDVTMSVYVELTLARTCIEWTEPTRYDRHASRLVVIPVVLLATVSGATFALAKWHPAKPGLPKIAAGSIKLGDQYRGETVFQSTCASCHGANGKGGGIGPRLQGLAITVAQVKAQIDAGGGSMPGGLVKGGDEADVLAYVATIVKQP
jgi:mono/diheme cytochrome c family protein